ncbi:platelet-activating factor acetylhydrolase IB subunit [Xanthomonas cannabis]|uniref:Lysophospholipase L1-like esterase n=1 Tax=Xanthomonas cannabis TaxID=1885674 RepID=A0ABR6JQ16_9XANT|nr:platelet-activating factor acetylhydrolase IB subunit [Xanthomonas cannabis]MBB4594924.1 lysophospholipase L1-like esterase [Xanthomonas cannabis]MBB5523740.1 lysophospholipase L1-like esterase [Xanthomonas cannabis]
MLRSLHAVFPRLSLSAIAPALVCWGLLLVCAAASAQTPPPSIVPTDRLQEPWWAQRHAQVLEQVRQHPETKLLLIGDSITQNYEKSKAPDEDFQPTWQTFYGSRGALNLGFSGDGTENVLWRLANGEVDGLQPKVALVLIGTNNTGHLGQSAEQAQLGIDAVVAAIEQKLPRTHILLLSVLPSGVSAEKSRRDAQVNQGLAVRYGDNPRVTYLDVSPVFQRAGTLRTELFYDTRFHLAAGALHPDTQGQRMLAEAIEPTLARLLGEAPVKPVAELGRDVATSLLPVDWLEQDSYDWYARHHAALAAARTLKPEVVMIGDSITHFWAGPPQATRVSGPASWQWLYGKRPVLNLGFGWDRTQNVLWRIRQGELDGLDPRWVVVHIGTNNLTGTAQSRASTPAEAAQGVEAVVSEVRRRLPNSKLILMAIMPRGRSAGDPQRAPIAETNRLLRTRYARDPAVRLVDIGPQLLQPDGSLPEALMPDGTHPSEAGYRIWAQALRAAGVTAVP